MLAAHPQITSIGEALQLRAYALQDRQLYDPAHPLTCSCGKPVPLCPFWQQVESALGAPLASLTLRPRLLESGMNVSDRSAVATRVWAPLRRWPNLYRFPPIHFALGSNVGRDSFRLYDAVTQVTGARYVVDSSKVPFRFWSLWRRRPDDLRLVVLVRDYRAVAYSQSKRGHSLRGAARYWVNTMRQVDALTRGLPGEQIFLVRYEDLCDSPEETMHRLCNFLQLEFSPELLARATVDLHHIGGSPSKFDSARRIVARDTTYLDQIAPADLRELALLAGDFARRWDYG
jgi:hypothetical protein